MNKYHIETEVNGGTRGQEMVASSTAVAVKAILDQREYRNAPTIHITCKRGAVVRTVWYVTISRKQPDGTIKWGQNEKAEPGMFYRTDRLARAQAKRLQDKDPDGHQYGSNKEYR